VSGLLYVLDSIPRVANSRGGRLINPVTAAVISAGGFDVERDANWALQLTNLRTQKTARNIQPDDPRKPWRQVIAETADDSKDKIDQSPDSNTVEMRKFGHS
jgi:hypothetical protein